MLRYYERKKRRKINPEISTGWYTSSSCSSKILALGSKQHYNIISIYPIPFPIPFLGLELNIPDRLIKNTLQVPLGQRRALKVLVRLDLLGTAQRLVVGYWLHALLAE